MSSARLVQSQLSPGAESALTPDGIPARLENKYRIIRKLGQGGMGDVYEARHELLNRRVAIKFIHASLASDPRFLHWFRREARAAGGLEHENICAVVDANLDPDCGRPFLVMEYIGGGSVRSLITPGGIAVPRALRIIKDACRGLQFAHDHGVIHRDLKPDNLMLSAHADGSEMTKVVDFGAARLVGVETTLTPGQPAAGTPHYMAPEQIRSESIDRRCDVYALGVILYELLTGDKPFNGRTYEQLVYSILYTRPQAVNSSRDLPAWLVGVVERALAADPEQRFADTQSMFDCIEQHSRVEDRTEVPQITSVPIGSVPAQEGANVGLRLIWTGLGGVLLVAVTILAWPQEGTKERPGGPVPSDHSVKSASQKTLESGSELQTRVPESVIACEDPSSAAGPLAPLTETSRSSVVPAPSMPGSRVSLSDTSRSNAVPAPSIESRESIGAIRPGTATLFDLVNPYEQLEESPGETSRSAVSVVAIPEN